MSNVAYADFGNQRRQERPTVADLDNGYTRIANELLDAIMLAGLTKHQLLMVMAVWRKTYGFNKKMDWVSNEQLESMTKIDSTKCSTAKNQLVRMKIFIQEGRKIGMNKNISEWETDIDQKSKTFTETVKNSFTETVKTTLPKQSNTKDNNTKNKKENNTPLTPQEGDCEKLISTNRKNNIPYIEIMNAFNEAAGDRLPNAESLNDKRKRAISKFLKELKEPTVEAAKNYFEYFMSSAKDFYFGENDSGWRANFDYLLRPSTVLKTREGSL
ncbi:replication protein [Providencia stuartii]|uniref:replication protein n=1 Tax=Providencia stuartii TaxID=588 RepID=UPI00090B8DD7|nr:replication protein [Providencia stuartii]APG52646.1 DNA replication protein [Providencia stuartii]